VYVLVFGSRYFKAQYKIDRAIRELSLKGDVTIIAGGDEIGKPQGLGVDWFAIQQARLYGMPNLEFKPDMLTPSPARYHIRNDKMLEMLKWDHGDHALAFWDGESRGTKSMIDKCLARAIDVRVTFDAVQEQLLLR